MREKKRTIIKKSSWKIERLLNKILSETWEEFMKNFRKGIEKLKKIWKLYAENLGKIKVVVEESLSINTHGGTEIPVFQRYVAGMIERAVRIISIIKK